MASSHISTASGDTTAPAPVATIPARPPTDAFDQTTLDEFENMLMRDTQTQALTANKRSHLKMILEEGYEVPRYDTLGQEKSKNEWKVENTNLWRAKKRWNVNSQDQVMRNAENGYGERIAACTYDAAKHIVGKHRELGHTGIAKTFESLQEDVYGIRRKDVAWLINRCGICNFQRPLNTKAPLEPIIVDRVMERLQINLINFWHSPDDHYK